MAAFLADDVEWTVSGPIDVLPFCGVHRGKAAVREMFERLTHQVFDVIKSERSTMLIDGDWVATPNRLWAKRRDDGRTISYRLAHFTRFQAGKVVEHPSLLDSFDLVEQVLGHPLTVSELADGDQVAV